MSQLHNFKHSNLIIILWDFKYIHLISKLRGFKHSNLLLSEILIILIDNLMLIMNNDLDNSKTNVISYWVLSHALDRHTGFIPLKDSGLPDDGFD
jgi:hypothetical protein